MAITINDDPAGQAAPHHATHDMLKGHDRAILQYSGGKDSTALLYLARPWLDRIEVVFGDTGAAFPHMREHIVRTCAKLGAKLTIVTPEEPIDEYHRRVGLPADVVPFWNTRSAMWTANDRARFPLQDPLRCCSARYWEPLMHHIQGSAATLVLRGAKSADSRTGFPDGVYGGVELRHPLWGWTDADVFEYLRREGAELPAHYGMGGKIDSMDCWSCTAHLPYGGAERLAWMRHNAPSLFAQLAPRLAHVRNVVAAEALEADRVIQDALAGGPEAVG